MQKRDNGHMKYVKIENHKLHIFTAGDENKTKLVLMSGSGTVAPMYDFKILYEKLVSDFRIMKTKVVMF